MLLFPPVFVFSRFFGGRMVRLHAPLVSPQWFMALVYDAVMMIIII